MDTVGFSCHGEKRERSAVAFIHLYLTKRVGMPFLWILSKLSSIRLSYTVVFDIDIEYIWGRKSSGLIDQLCIGQVAFMCVGMCNCFFALISNSFFIIIIIINSVIFPRTIFFLSDVLVIFLIQLSKNIIHFNYLHLKDVWWTRWFSNFNWIMRSNRNSNVIYSYKNT